MQAHAAHEVRTWLTNQLAMQSDTHKVLVIPSADPVAQQTIIEYAQHSGIDLSKFADVVVTGHNGLGYSPTAEGPHFVYSGIGTATQRHQLVEPVAPPAAPLAAQALPQQFPHLMSTKTR